MLLDVKMDQMQLQQQQQPGTAVLYNAAGQVVAITLPPQPSAYQSYKTGQSMFTGVSLIIAGILSIIFNSIGISLHEVFTYGGVGIWCGVMVSKLNYVVHIILNVCLLLIEQDDGQLLADQITTMFCVHF